jgi:hypothetical protein
MEREYLQRRISAERRLAQRARSGAAGAAHREMERIYAAKLAQIGGAADPRPGRASPWHRAAIWARSIAMRFARRAAQPTEIQSIQATCRNSSSACEPPIG